MAFGIIKMCVFGLDFMLELKCGTMNNEVINVKDVLQGILVC